MSDFKRYIISNPGVAFVLLFQAFVVGAAISLATTNLNLSNSIALYAFYSLVIGVAIQVFIAIRSERRKPGDRKGPG